MLYYLLCWDRFQKTIYTPTDKKGIILLNQDNRKYAGTDVCYAGLIFAAMQIFWLSWFRRIMSCLSLPQAKKIHA